MDAKKISEKNNVVEILIKGADAALMNSIRRTVLNAIPIFAIEDVLIYENSSVLFDEFLAQRLALIPIKTDLKRYKEGEKVVFTLEKEGPGIVYSKDLKVKGSKGEIIDKRIPIVNLSKDQKVKLEAIAVVGKGKEHAKWQSAVIGYRELPIINVGKECNLCKECIKTCPPEVLELKAKKLVLGDPINCILCGKCRDVCPKNCLVLDYDDSSFVLHLESHGNLKSSEIMLRAVESLKEKTKEFRKAIKKL